MTLTNEQLLLAGMGVAIFLLIAALIVVRIARGLERSGGMKAVGVRATTQTGRVGLVKQWASHNPALAATLKLDTKSGAKRATGIITALVVAGIGLGFGVVRSRNGDITVETKELATPSGLHGTFVTPGGKRPVVLIVPGSGPTDRDGNNPAGIKANMYAMLADGLAQKRIASVRVDKRGMFGSAGAGDPNDVSIAKYSADYGEWIDAIKAETGQRCVWLLGHSEGALMVSAAAQGRKDVCGLILVSGMGRKFGDVLRQQLRDNPANAPVLDEALRALSELEAGRHVDTTSMTPALLALFQPRVQDYMISLLAVDPVDVLRKAGKKSLIVQGTHDLQVKVEDAQLLNKVPRTRMRLIDGMNHVLKIAPEDFAGNVATYQDATLPLAPKLVSAISAFIKDDD